LGQALPGLRQQSLRLRVYSPKLSRTLLWSIFTFAVANDPTGVTVDTSLGALHVAIGIGLTNARAEILIGRERLIRK